MIAWVLGLALLVVDPVARFDDGAAHFAARDLAAARAAFVASIRDFEDEGRTLDAALGREALARVQIEQGDWLGADETLAAARPAIDALPPRHPHRARHVALRAILAQGLGDLEVAADAHERALTEYRALLGNQHARVAAMLQNYATLTAARSDSLTTDILLLQAMDIVDRNHGPDDMRRTRPLVTWAQWRLHHGDLTEARRALVEADRIVCRARGLEHADRIQILRTRARVAAAADSIVVATRHVARAAAIYDSIWMRGGADLLRATAFTSPFGEWSGLLARAGDFDGAWSAWEAHVGRLADLGRPSPTRDDVAAVMRDGEAFVGWTEDTTSSGPVRRWAFVITKAGLRWVDLGVDPADGLERQLRSRLADFADGDPGQALARRVRARWFGNGKIVTDDVRRLIVVPSGELLGVPVGVLFTGGQPGGRRAPAVVRVPSATSFVEARRRPAHDRAPEHLLALADPEFGSSPATFEAQGSDLLLRSAAAGNAGALASLPPLHATRDEVESIARLFTSSVVLLGDDATEARLRDALHDARRTDVIHLATHALVDPIDPARSAIVFSGAGDADVDGPGDGLLSVREILDEWTLDADLVTLSACDTGLGRATPTEGLLGFPHALLRVGARSVLVSAWKVEDRATALWMEAFYTAWLEGGRSRADAARAAQAAVRTWENAAGRRPFADPAYWAAFELVGE